MANYLLTCDGIVMG